MDWARGRIKLLAGKLEAEARRVLATLARQEAARGLDKLRQGETLCLGDNLPSIS